MGAELHENFVNGKFVAAKGVEALPVMDPAKDVVISEIPDSSSQHVDEAVSAATEAQRSWERLPAIERAGYLRQISAKIRENADDLADTIVREQGKVSGLATVEVQFTADYIDYMAEWARRIEGEIIASDRQNENIFLFRQPIGVVGGILPWNFPFFLIARKTCPSACHWQYDCYQAERGNAQQCSRVCETGCGDRPTKWRLQPCVRLRFSNRRGAGIPSRNRHDKFYWKR